MPFAVCSLITNAVQVIPREAYTIVRFPFGDAESYDPFNMHAVVQPDTGESTTASNPRAGLIWPAHDGWATLTATMQWEDISGFSPANRPSHMRHRFVRDPLDLSTGYDSTATSDHPPRPVTKGGTCKTKTWNIFVHPGTPLGYLVYHNAGAAMDLTFAEFKLSYWYDA